MKINVRYIFPIILIIPLLFTCETRKGTITSFAEIDTTDVYGPTIKKPNIYFYPEDPIEIDISITFPFGGILLESVPEYEYGWHVHIDKTGLIDNEFTYIYYECRAPIQFQTEEGWIIERDNLSTFFQDNMKKYGFNSQEITDFTAYWIPILNNSDRYIIYPQTDKEIAPYIQLNFSIEPQTILRLYYKIEEYTGLNITLAQPEIQTGLRNGFTIAEWGVIFE